MATPHPVPVVISAAQLRYALGLLFLANVVNYVDRSIVGVLIEPIRSDLHLSDTQIGVMTGFAFALFYGIAGLYLAHLADTKSRPLIISLSIVAWSMMAALTGAAQNFWQLLLVRVGVGVGEAGLIPAANALLADSHTPARRPFALAVFTAGSMVGVMAGSIVGGALVDAYGWRWTFVATGAAGLPLALLVWLTLRDPGRGASDGLSGVSPVPFPAAIKLILLNKSLLLLILGYASLVFMLFGVITWFPAFLVRQYGLGLAQVGLEFGLALGLGTAVGGVFGGAVGSRLAARDLAWLTRIPVIAMLFLWPLYEAAIFAPTARASVLIIALVAAVGGASLGPALAAMQMLFPAAIRAKGAALNGLICSLIGGGGGPLLVGVISDHYTASLGPAAALQRGLAIAVCAAAIGALLMWLAHRNFTRHLSATPSQSISAR